MSTPQQTYRDTWHGDAAYRSGFRMTDADVSFFCPGVAAPGGSKAAFRSQTGRIVVKDDCKRNKSWRQTVALFAFQAMKGRLPLADPLKVVVSFVMPRPDGHFGTGRNAGSVKASAPAHPTVRPDATKLWRAAEDALTGVVWRDDSQIVEQTVCKSYGDQPGVTVEVYVLPSEAAR